MALNNQPPCSRNGHVSADPGKFEAKRLCSDKRVITFRAQDLHQWMPLEIWLLSSSFEDDRPLPGSSDLNQVIGVVRRHPREDHRGAACFCCCGNLHVFVRIAMCG